MDEVSQQQPQADPETGIVIEALSREDGKNSTVRVFRDRIEWHKELSISSMPRAKNDPPVIPLSTVSSVKAKKDGPLFSKVVMRTDFGTIVFRMHAPQAVEVRDAIAGLLAAGPVESGGVAPPPPPPPPPAAPVQDDLAQLEWLRDEGMLSPEQFEAAKARLGPA